MRAVAVFFNNVGSAQPSPEIQRTEGVVELDVRIVWTFFQVIFNFPFELVTVCGRHNERAPFVILLLFSQT